MLIIVCDVYISESSIYCAILISVLYLSVLYFSLQVSSFCCAVISFSMARETNVIVQYLYSS